MNRQSIENGEAVAFADTVHLFRLNPWLLELIRQVPFGRKVMTNLDNILKSRDITFPAKVHLVKAMVFPVVMYGHESWTLKLSAKELMLLNCRVREDS